MSSQCLSDEAVAAFADGVLRGHARERATKHTASCAECAHAVTVQREAAWALRAAPAPALPGGLADRLRGLPLVTPVTLPPTVFGDDGTPMLSTFAPTADAPMATSLPAPMPSSTRAPMAPMAAPMAALVPPQRERRHYRVNPIVTTAAVVALTGALSVGAAVYSTGGDDGTPGSGQVVQQLAPHPGTVEPVIAPVNVFRAAGR